MENHRIETQTVEKHKVSRRDLWRLCNIGAPNLWRHTREHRTLIGHHCLRNTSGRHISPCFGKKSELELDERSEARVVGANDAVVDIAVNEVFHRTIVQFLEARHDEAEAQAIRSHAAQRAPVAFRKSPAFRRPFGVDPVLNVLTRLDLRNVEAFGIFPHASNEKLFHDLLHRWSRVVRT